MRTISIACTSLMLFALGAPARSQPAPDELAGPDPALLERFYPDAAMRLGVSGSVLLGCDLIATGKLMNCKVFAEEPTGVGFGASALAMSSELRFRPNTGATYPHRVAVPLSYHGQTGRAPTFLVGAGAVILTNPLPANAGASAEDNALSCFEANNRGRCVFHSLKWAKSPDVDLSMTSVLKSAPREGGGIIICAITDSGSLSGCTSSDAATTTVLSPLMADFKAPPTTSEGIATKGQLVAMVFDWSRIYPAAQSMAPDAGSPRP